MKNKRIFSLSSAIISENLKMYWYLPALSFIIYFMAGIFPLLVDNNLMTEPNNLWYLEDSLRNYNVAYCLLMIIVPLISAVMMMGFLHNPVRATALHSQPFSRNKIFCSHILTGWLMCIMPVIVMTLLYSLMNHTTTSTVYWMVTSAIIITFFYGMFVLAGSLVGNSVMHVLLSGVFFGIIPLIIWITMMFCESFLEGFYSIPEPIEDFMINSNPIFSIISNYGESLPLENILIFGAAGLIMLVLASIAYSRAKLERVGDSMMYRIFEEIITWLVVFVGMSAFGYFFYKLVYTKVILLMGMAFGSLLSFIVVKIVLARSIKIINKENLISLGIYAILACLFVSITIYDLSGFTKRVPDVDDIDFVYRDTYEWDDMFYYYNFEENFIENDQLSSPETIEKIVALHQYIVDNKLYSQDAASKGYFIYRDSNGTVQSNKYSTIYFHYTTKNGSSIQRYFGILPDETAINMINDILNSEEYKDKGNLSDNIKVENVSYIQVYTYDYSYDEEIDREIAYEKSGTDYVGNADTKSISANNEVTVIIDDPEEIEEFLAALRKDYYNRTYRFEYLQEDLTDIVTSSSSILSFNMDISGSIIMKPGSEGTITASDEEQTSNQYYSAPQSEVNFFVRGTDKNTLKLLGGIFEKEGYDYYAKRINEL